MKRVENDTDWTLMCPDHCPGLADCYGDDFEQLYNEYESEYAISIFANTSANPCTPIPIGR